MSALALCLRHAPLQMFFCYVQNNFPRQILLSASAMLTHLKMVVTPSRSKRGPPRKQSASARVMFVVTVVTFCNEISISNRAMLLTMVFCVRDRV
jgi:hypothetical protein